MSGHNWNKIIDTMNSELVKVVEWLRANKISLNLKKRRYILFRRHRGKMKIEKDININGIKVEKTDKTKFLGVVLDQHLSFAHHTNYIRGKVARGIGILYKCRRLFNENTLLTLYNSIPI